MWVVYGAQQSYQCFCCRWCYWLELWWLTTYLPTCPHYSRTDRFHGSLTLKETCIEDWWKKPRWMCGVDMIELRKSKWWRGREGERGNDSPWSGELIGDSRHSFALCHIGEMLSLWVAMVTGNGWALFNVSSCTYMGEGWGQWLNVSEGSHVRGAKVSGCLLSEVG